MSSRRNFLKQLGLGFGLFAVTPQLLKALDKSEGTETTFDINEDTTIESLRNSLNNLSEDDKELTEKFFEYLKKNNVGFTWERVYSPIFQLKTGKVLQVHAYKTKTKFNENWKCGYFETSFQSLSGGTFIEHQYETIDQYYDMLFTRICSEMRKNSNSNRFYIYQLMFSPVMYDPEYFDAERAIAIRYAKR